MTQNDNVKFTQVGSRRAKKFKIKPSCVYILIVTNFVILVTCLSFLIVLLLSQSENNRHVANLENQLDDSVRLIRINYLQLNALVKNSSNTTNSEQYSDVFAEMDDKLTKSHIEILEVKDRMEAFLVTNPNSLDALQRVSGAYFQLVLSAWSRNQTDHLLVLLDNGLKHANLSIHLNNTCLKCHQNYLDLFGFKLDFIGTLAEKFIHTPKVTAEIAYIENLDPHYWFVYDVKAGVQRRVSQLSWVEKNFGSLLIDMDFSFDYDQIVDLYTKAINNGPKSIVKKNYYFIGETYINSGNLATGYKWIEKSKNMPTTTPYEEYGERLLNDFLSTHQDEYELYLNATSTSANIP